MFTGFYGVWGFFGVLSFALALFGLYAFIDAATHREDAYRAAGKNTKGFWLIILGVSALVMKIFSFLSFLPALGLVATIVYMVDVRPAVRGTGGRGTPRRRSGGGSSSDGPYGPYNGRR